MKIINGENLVLGRVASRVAKAALLGHEVALLNCEKLIITGSKSNIMAHQHSMAERKGKPEKGLFYETRADRFVRKVIRHMLPKNARGLTAYHKIKCFIQVPEALKASPAETFEADNLNKLPNIKYMTVGDVCRRMGGKWTV